jgi:hypothetical protein
MKNNIVTYTHYIVTNNHCYVLKNYKEIIEYYKLPFYKKWITKKPVKELININQMEHEYDVPTKTV